MNKKFPVRAVSHELEELSRRFFKQHLPSGWTTTKPEDDYGIDYYVEICEDGKMAGKNFIVQLKASDSSNGIADYETILLETSTYNYLMGNPLVAILVKFNRQDQDAYWVFLRDIPSPSNPEQETITIRVPKINRLSKKDWFVDIVSRIATIQGIKISAAEGV